MGESMNIWSMIVDATWIGKLVMLSSTCVVGDVMGNYCAEMDHY